MAYVDQTYYSGTYLGVSVDPADFPRYEARAEEIIDLLIRGRISSGESASFSPDLALKVKNAICAQIEYYVYNGIDIAATGVQATGFTVGKVSVSKGSSGSASARSGAGSMVSPQAEALLAQTGLTNPAVGSVGVLGFWGWF